MFRFVNGVAPDYCCDMFTTVQYRHDMNTGSSAKDALVVPKMNLSTGQRNIRYYSVKVWENISPEIKGHSTLDSFNQAIYSR